MLLYSVALLIWPRPASCEPDARIAPKRPNVLLVLTDDQGYSDVGFNGNPLVETPAIDRLARESALLDPFYAQPVCMPSRAALMTGRDPNRSGVIDIGSNGRSMLYQQEWTLAEAFRDAGYATAIFGKWHLGDHYPMRPMDRGFGESVVHHAGMMGGEDSIPGERGYFDPILFHNGIQEKYDGYCNDIYTDLAVDFIKKNQDHPFFIYYSTNLPHHPLVAMTEDEEVFRKKGLSDETAGHYGMIRNIDRNLDRMLVTLDKLGLRDNTIVIFLGDNGSSSLLVEKDRHESGLRGRKTQVYEGGIRVPCLISWPGHFKAGRIDQPTSVMDLMPTLLQACSIPQREDVEFDGKSLVPLLLGNSANWPGRNLYFRWDGSTEIKESRNFAVRDDRFKLVHAPAIGSSPDAEIPYALYDLKKDPGETTDISAEYPDKVSALKKSYLNWDDKMRRDSGRSMPGIVLGHDAAPVILGPWDKRGVEKGNPGSGHWDLNIENSGPYEVIVRLREPITIRKAGQARLQIGNVEQKKSATMSEWEIRFDAPDLPAGAHEMRAWVDLDEKLLPIDTVEIRRKPAKSDPGGHKLISPP